MEWLLVPDGLVWVFLKLMIYWDFHTQLSLGFTENCKKKKIYIYISCERQLCGRKCLVNVRGQRRMGRMVRDDRKATVTLITTRYNQDMQNTISERTTRRTLQQMGYSSRKPHREPLLSAKNRKRRLQFCLVSMVQAAGGGVMVWGIFSWHTLYPLVPTEHRLNTTAYLSIVGDHVHPFMTTVYPAV